jgi:hypothetical protein
VVCIATCHARVGAFRHVVACYEFVFVYKMDGCFFR